MPGTIDDRRAAATIATSLSGYVIAGALALIGAEAAIFVYLIDKKIIGYGIWTLLFLCLACLSVSCYLGGKGIWKIYADGANGAWNTTAGGLFGFQTLLALAGIVLLIWLSISASHAPENPSEPKLPEHTQISPPPQQPPTRADSPAPLPLPTPAPPRKRHHKPRCQCPSAPAKTN